MKALKLWLLIIILALALAACGGAATEEPTQAPAATTAPAEPTKSEEPLVFGLIMVGPKDDHGWNEAHYEAAAYVMEKEPGTQVVWFDKLNPADNPDLTIEQVSDDLIAQGAKVIFTNSAEFADATNNAAKAHPDVTFIHVSGDDVLEGKAPSNVGNFMGRMEYGKMMAGCAAAMTTQTGSIAYLGPLIDSETRRLVNSSYLGARYCWENERGMDPADLSFSVTWIGFWFNIPGVTLDPTQVANDFFNNGADVIISGIDTTEGLVVARQRSEGGEAVWSIPYDFRDACAEAQAVCLGVPYFNWGPAYLKTIREVKAGTWQPSWDWNGPDWADINNVDTSAVGWINGPALSAEAQAAVTNLTKGLADGSINLYSGPLNFQDGTVFVADGQTATDAEIWGTPQLLQGITGASQ